MQNLTGKKLTRFGLAAAVGALMVGPALFAGTPATVVHQNATVAIAQATVSTVNSSAINTAGTTTLGESTTTGANANNYIATAPAASNKTNTYLSLISTAAQPDQGLTMNPATAITSNAANNVAASPKVDDPKGARANDANFTATGAMGMTNQSAHEGGISLP